MTLMQHISKYYQITLKLEEVDKFQKVQEFLCNLHHDYKTKVKTQNPKTLENAIEIAQIYDDIIDDKPSHGFTQSTSQSTYGANCKMGSTSREAVSKKPKGASSPLSRDELARTHHEELCLQILGLYERKECL